MVPFSFNLQQLCLGHPNIREKLGLPVKEASAVATSNKETEKIGVAETGIISTKGGKISVQNLSPEELVAVSGINKPFTFTMF